MVTPCTTRLTSPDGKGLSGVLPCSSAVNSARYWAKTRYGRATRASSRPSRPVQHDSGPVRIGNRLGADHRDGVLAELRADLGDDVEVVASGVRIGGDVDDGERVAVERGLWSVPEAQRRVEVGDHLTGRQFQHLQGRFVCESLERTAAQVHEPLLLGLARGSGCRAAGPRRAPPRGPALHRRPVWQARAAAGTSTASRSGSTSWRSRCRWCVPACRRRRSSRDRCARGPVGRRDRR